MIADKILKDSNYKKMKDDRYSSFNSKNGRLFQNGSLTLEELSGLSLENENLETTSGKQELFEAIINQFIK